MMPYSNKYDAIPICRTTLLKKKYMKNFKIKTRVIRSLMEEEIPSGTK